MPELRALANRYLELALHGEREEAAALPLAPLADGRLSLAALYDDVLAVAAGRIGDLWHAGAITVADEHLATRLTLDVMARARGLAAREEARGAPVVLACPPDEQHELGLQMLADVLAAGGRDPRLLGAQTPVRDLVAYAGEVGAAVVALSCSTALAIPGLVAAIDGLAEGLPGVRVLLGGRAAADYPALGGAVGADEVCTRLGDALRALDALTEGGVRAPRGRAR